MYSKLISLFVVVFTFSANGDTATKGELECRLFQLDMANNQALGPYKEVTKQKSQPFPIGTFTSFEVQFPAPHQDVKVYFQHGLNAFGETGSQMIPYIQLFAVDERNPRDTKRRGNGGSVNFEIAVVKAGSRIMLRGNYGYSLTSALYYQCSLNFL